MSVTSVTSSSMPSSVPPSVEEASLWKTKLSRFNLQFGFSEGQLLVLLNQAQGLINPVASFTQKVKAHSGISVPGTAELLKTNLAGSSRQAVCFCALCLSAAQA